MNTKALCLMTFVLVLVTSGAARAADYYVDRVGGNDGNSGTSPAEAWQSLGPVNSTIFSPGDHIYFKAGTKYIGRLKPQGLGVDGSPIVIDMYGDGNKPCIDANGSPAWCSEMSMATPILSNHRKISLPDMVYIKSINRYLLLTWSLKRDFDCDSGSELYIYDSPQPCGPFTLAYVQDPWENKDISPYCPRIPLKWLRQTEDGIEGWMQFSGSWRQNSLHYRSHVRHFHLVLIED